MGDCDGYCEFSVGGLSTLYVIVWVSKVPPF